MENDLKILLEKAVLSEETKEALSTAWAKKVEAVREEVATELRQEFASRFEHDKGVIVEGMDNFLTTSLTKEIEVFAENEKKLAEERVALENKGKMISEKFEKFMEKALSDELKEFKSERKMVAEAINKAEKFVVTKLAEEISEYEESKAKLIEERVAVETEKKAEIAAAKKLFVEKASVLAEKVINETIKTEFTQLRQDLEEARKLTLGRKIFEAFATEFGANFFNESAEVKKISEKVSELNKQLSEAKKSIEDKDIALSESAKQVKVAQELVERNTVMGDILSTLDANKRSVMRKLLESVETSKLRDSYKKFLPTVLNAKNEGRKSLVENTEATSHEGRRFEEGNRKAMVTKEQSPELTELSRLVHGSF